MVPENLKPDRSKVVLGLDLGGTRLVAYADADAPLAWRRDPMFAFLKAQARRSGSGWHVVVRVGEHMWLIEPNEVFDMGVIPPGATYYIDWQANEPFLAVQRSDADGGSNPEATRLARVSAQAI